MKHLLLRNAFTLKALLLVSMIVGAVSGAWAQESTLTEGFEKATTSTSYQGTVTVTEEKSDCGIGWEIFYGTVSTTSKITGNNSAAMRLYAGNDNYGYLKTTTPIEGLTKVTFNIKAGKDKTIKVIFSYSSDGTTWTDETAFTPATSAQNLERPIPAGNKYIKFAISSTSTKPSSGNVQLTIDDVVFTYSNTDPSKEDAGLSFGETTIYNVSYGETFTAPTLINPNDLEVTYESGNEDVARVDENTGEITIVGGGEAIITASSAETDLYNAGRASYTLNVTDNRIATSISYGPIELDLADVATLTKLAPVVMNAQGDVIEYTYVEFPPTVSYEIVSDPNSIIGSLDWNSGDISLNAVEGTATLKAYYNLYNVNSNYKPSECTFTITVAAPFSGGDVTFDAGTDTDKGNTSQGKGSITKKVVTFACSNGVLGNGTEYRLYKDSQTTFTTTEGKITQIEFTQSGSYSISNLTPDTGSLVDLTWTGRASSVVFTASAQARASQIVVTVDLKADPELSFDESADLNATVGEPFTAPALANPHELPVSYESNNVDVATVDASTGTVAIIGVGEATITASTEGDETYSAGSVSYTIKVTAANQVVTPEIALGAENFFESTTATITCKTDGATILYSTDKGETWQTYTGVITLTETTTIVAKATKEGATDSEVCEAVTATKNNLEENLAALAAKSAGKYYVNFNNVVVTYVNGNNAYMKDASGAILLYKSGHGFTAGQVINGVASVTLQIRNNNPQLTALTGVEGYSVVDGTAPEPTTVAADEWDTQINTVLGQYLKVTGATITSESSKYYVQLGEEKVQLYGQGDARTISVEDYDATYTIVGFPTMYNTTPELQIFVQPEKEEAEDKRADVVLSFEKPEYTATLGETFTAPTLFVKDESGADIEGLTITYSFESFGNLPIEINAETGAVTLKTEGEATVIATFAGDDEYKPATASYKLIVVSNKTASNLAIDEPNSTTLNVGDKIQLGYTSEGDGDITWKSSNEAVMTVDQQGNVTAVAVGEATITVAQSETESCLADEASIKLTVVDPNQGQHLWLLSEASYSSASTEAVTWTSDYATMDVTRAEGGTAANNYLGGDKYTSTRFYTNSTLTIARVEGYRIASVLFQATTEGYAKTFKNSTWTNVEEVVISGEKVVTITPTDGMEAIVATIGGTCGFEKVQVTYVKTEEVVKQSANLAFAETSFSVEPEADFTAPKLTTAEGFDGTIVYSSTDDDIALVDETTGEVLIGAKEGVVTITATSAETENFKAGSASYTITVKAPEKAEPEISFAEAIYTVNIGEEFTAPALINPHGLTVTYSCDNAEIALVDETTGDVVLDTQAKATVTITATFAGDETYKAGSASYTIKIVDPTASTTIYCAFVTEYDGKVYAVNNTISSSTLGATEVTIINGKVLADDNIIWKVSEIETEEGSYTIQSKANDKYLGYNKTSFSLNDNPGSYTWTYDAAAGYYLNSDGSRSLIYGRDVAGFKNYATSNVTKEEYSAVAMPMATASGCTRTLSNTWGTVCFDHQVLVENTVNARFYWVAGKVLNEAGEPIKLMLREEDMSLKTGYPFIVEAIDPTAPVALLFEEGEVVENALNMDGLYGTFTGTSVPEDAYILKGGNFVKCGTGCSVGPNRAYLNMEEVPEYYGDESGVKVFNLGGEDGISSLDAASEGAVIYDLSGRRVSKTVKGLYIVNGKKVAVK